MTAAEAVASRRSAVAFSRLRRGVAEIDVWWWPLIAMLVIWTAYFTHESIEIHNGLGTSSYDLGLYDQGVWLLSRFHSPFVTLMGRNLFGDHTSFVMVLFVPIYWVAPSVGSLLLVQSAVIAAGAVPIFLYARQRLESGWIALVFGGAYLLHPAVGWTNLENFHPDSFLGFFVGMAIWAALSRRWRTYTVFVVLSLLVKEDVSLVIVPLGVWVALAPRPSHRADHDPRFPRVHARRDVRHHARSDRRAHAQHMAHPVRRGVRAASPTAIKRPGELFEYLRTENRPWYLWQMVFPAAWASVRRPAIAAISAVVLVANVVSVYWYQHQVEFHYSLIAVPALTLGAVYGVAALGDRLRTITIFAIVATSVWASILWSPLPWSRRELTYWPPSHPSAVAASRDPRRHPLRRSTLGALSPGAAPVSSHRRLPVPQPVPDPPLRTGCEQGGHSSRAAFRGGGVRGPSVATYS